VTGLEGDGSDGATLSNRNGPGFRYVRALNHIIEPAEPISHSRMGAYGW
jgi:hypothetical protein